MTQGIRGWCALVILALATTAHAAERTELQVSYRLWLDADGQVRALAPKHELHQALDAALRRSIAGWSFVPGAVNGEPQPTESWLHLRLRATQVEAGRLALDLVTADVGPGYVKTVPPHYPASALMQRIEGEVELRVEIDAEGHVLAVQPAREHPRRLRTLVAAATESMRHWRFEPERVAGHGVATTVTVPICFRVHVEGSRPSNPCQHRNDEPPRAERVAAQLRTPVEGVRIEVGG
ncbi:MAG: energy transducer TonB [Rehaibacterium terrae]|uniref:energy transducer TonB n=1 Tax=Rehaibacterium terrae TaxID=1341696 RepID=UPI00391B4EE7